MKRTSLFFSLMSAALLAVLASCTSSAPATLPAALPASVTSTAVAKFPSSATPGRKTELATPAAVSPTGQPTTPTPIPTLEPSLTPAPTPFPTLAASGPYLAYLRNDGDRQHVVVRDSKGVGCKETTLPKSSFVPDLAAMVSPSGEWLTFYSGTASRSDSDTGPYDLSLDLLRLTDGQVFTITALLSPDYPNNFQKNAELLSKSDPKRFPLTDQLVTDLQGAFMSGIYSSAWSPDSRYLAFAGEMDGPSSDLYIYDLRSHTIRRLSDGLGEIQEITWSPDGRWIVHGSAYYSGEGMAPDFFVARADGSGVKPIGGGKYSAGWLSPSENLRYSGANGPGTFGLQKVNIETGQVIDWWSPPFWPFAYNKAHNLLAVWTMGDMVTAPGLYLVAPPANRLTPLTGLNGHVVDSIEGLSDSVNLFAATDATNATALLIRADRTTTQVGDTCHSIAVSPDGRLLALYEPGLTLYSSSGTLVRSVAVQPVVGPHVEWSPDSKGLLLSGEPGLYYVPAAEGEVAPVAPYLKSCRIAWQPDSGGAFFTSGTDLFHWNVGDAQPTLADPNVSRECEFEWVWLK
jgi:WD40 repeat protein